MGAVVRQPDWSKIALTIHHCIWNHNELRFCSVELFEGTLHQYSQGGWVPCKAHLGQIFTRPTEAEVTSRQEATTETFPKQERYKDESGEDWIDECARTFTTEEFRGAMKFTIGKYNRRIGKKDDITKEITKMEDYCRRWRMYESFLLENTNAQSK